MVAPRRVSFQERVADEASMRLVVAVLGKDDLELASGIHDDEMADATSAMVEQFLEQEKYYIGAAEVFRSAAARLAVVVTRYAYNLGRDGNPLASN